ncbi:MAG: protein kinase [Myxococcales bacterium]
MSLAGKTIGNYKVVQQIGEGGMGVVYLAEHPVIGRKVAIKLLHNSFAKDSETVARFFNEARAIHLIAHPNIVEILDFGQTTEGQPYFIMEYLSGESLAERIARGPVPPDEAVTIVSQICDALQAAHDKKIVHRDLKPHNVYLLDHNGRQIVKILDFGVAKMSTGWDAAQSGGQSVKTRTGSLMGTPLYMSPEQCRGSGKLDHRTDIYSLAVILFEMISKRPPFVAEGVGELFAKHMLEPAPSLAEFAPATPPYIVRAVARALSKDLDDRFSDMNAFRDALLGQPDVAVSQAARPRRAAGAQGTPGPRPHQSAQDRELPPEQTTLSSMVSELEGGELNGFPARSRKGLVIGIALAATAVLAGVIVLRKNRTAAVANVSAAPSPATETAPAPVSTPSLSTPTPAAPESVVTIKFQAEPAGTRLLRKRPDSRELEDVGDVPLELKLPRGSEATEYVLRAENHKDRTVTVDPSHDQVVHLALERESSSAAEKERDRRPRPAPSRPAKPKRPVIEDGDGLAVPSF